MCSGHTKLPPLSLIYVCYRYIVLGCGEGGRGSQGQHKPANIGQYKPPAQASQPQVCQHKRKHKPPAPDSRQHRPASTSRSQRMAQAPASQHRSERPLRAGQRRDCHAQICRLPRQKEIKVNSRSLQHEEKGGWRTRVRRKRVQKAKEWHSREP